ncbi:MAG: ABC-F family ATP-binding cassette domain-containing protein, partial [Spirochaetales bacterium]|nr:ABC-F family ATP-binding cassette domain-containing protein [Spirochaetales bacterium]
MNILSIEKLTKLGKDAPLFKNISFGIDSGEKVALIGKNGCGKSTLLSVIAGEIPADEGKISKNKEAGVAFLHQNPPYNPENSIREHLFAGSSPRLQLIRDYEYACETGAIEKLDELTRKMDECRGWEYEQEVRSVLQVLGISNLDIKMKELSGGMLKKVSLAQVLIEDCKLLILDEPTNHLDMTTISWLEDYLVKTNKALLMVTHDRYFLDNVCSTIYEIDNQTLYSYKGNFSYYLEKKSETQHAAERNEERIESILRKEMEWLKRGPKARGTKAKARKDAIYSMINREKLQKDKGFEFAIETRRLGGVILEADNLNKSFNDKKLLDGFSYTFKKGERLGIFGGNGTGKTTFLNLLTQTLEPDSGSIKKGINTHIAYYNQDPPMLYSDTKVIDYMKEAAEVIHLPDGTTLSAVKFLERFGFTSKHLYSPLNQLSGGEKRRVYLVRLLLENPNFLILDEPTNDLDIQTMSILEDFLENYAGCLIVVSHDRYFMDRTIDHMLIFSGNGDICGFAS